MSKTYIGTKLIKAQPMTRAEYNTYRGWALPADENGADEGYLVDHLLPHAQRVIGEKAQLQDKVTKLRAFVGSSPFMALTGLERDQLTDQLGAMEHYLSALSALSARIAAFPATPTSVASTSR